MKINKSILLITGFILFHLISMCQGFYPGIFAGIIGSQVDGDRLTGYNKPGASLGICLTYNLNEISYIQTEFEFIQKGSRKVAHPDQGDINSYKIKLNYVEVPFLYNYVIKKKYIPEAGIGLAYLINSMEVIDGYNYTPVPKFNAYEYSFILGFNYKPSEKFRINIRYSYSILPIRQLEGDISIHFDRSQYNNLMSFSIYYYFFKITGNK